MLRTEINTRLLHVKEQVRLRIKVTGSEYEKLQSITTGSGIQAKHQAQHLWGLSEQHQGGYEL